MSLRNSVVLASRGCFVGFLLLVGLTMASQAQQGRNRPRPRNPADTNRVRIDCVGGACNQLEVTPDGGSTPSRAAQTTGYTQDFNILNNSGVASTWEVTCAGINNVTCTGTNPSSVTLGLGQQVTVTATYNVGNVATGKLILRTIDGPTPDTGYVTVPIVGTPGKPGMAFRNHNRENRERSLCLTMGAGEGAAFQCGDLLVTHGMPGFTTLGRERSLTLLYNSGQAFPKPTVAVAVNQKANVARPDSVLTELRVNGVLKASNYWVGWGGGGTDQVRQLVSSYSAETDSSGIYGFTYLVRNIYGTTIKDTVLADTLMVVNRVASKFGTGWGLAGVEQLYFNQPVGTATGDILWVGGDASARWYRKINATTWVAPLGGFRDTLTLSGGVYTRTLRHGVKVKFDGSGRHIQTVNRTGHATDFTWDANNRLTTITVPPTGATYRTYTIQYDGNGKLDRITDPVGRILDATVTSGKLLSLVDPDSKTTSFAYAAGQSPNLISSRTNRRGITTWYGYWVNRLSGFIQPIDSAGTTHADYGFVAWDTRTQIDTAQASTWFIGPRPFLNDDANFWVDRWGAPVKTQDALGVVTTIVRSSPTMPALVTKVVAANGRIDTMTYNSRGNLTEQRTITNHLGSIGLPTRFTTYTYADNTTKDSPTRVQDALGRHSDYTYDSLGLASTITDQRNHVSTIVTLTGAATKGLVSTITEQSVPVWKEMISDTVALNLVTTFYYNTQGNQKSFQSGSGMLTTYIVDSIGRITQIYDPYGTHKAMKYDVLNRMVADTQHTYWYNGGLHPGGVDPRANCSSNYFNCVPALQSGMPSAPNLVTNYYIGALTQDSVSDPRGVKRRFRFDARGLVLGEKDELGVERTAVYDVGGSLTSSTSRSNLTTRFYYDLNGRRTSMAYSTRGLYGQSVLGDSIKYVFDNMGQLIADSNRHNIIRRTYYADGSLRSKRTTSLADSLVYNYDATGALTTMMTLGGYGNRRDSVFYQYDSNGDLDLLTIVWDASPAKVPRVFNFDWDRVGRLSRLIYPNNDTVRFAYDPAGNLRQVKSTNPQTAPGVTDRLDFTLRNRFVDPAGRVYHQTLDCTGGLDFGDLEELPCASNGGTKETYNRYSQIGMLVSQQHGAYTDTMKYDESGNLVFKHAGSGIPERRWFIVDPGTNRMVRDSSPAENFRTLQFYDADGAQSIRRPSDSTLNTVSLWRWYYYDGLGRMTGSRFASWNASWGLDLHDDPDDCWYDADGQMMLACDNASPLLTFDGPNSSATGSGWRFIHAPGVDAPIMGMYRDAGGFIDRELYFVTDGSGQQLAVGDLNGHLETDDFQGSSQKDWRYAGHTRNAQGFGADRYQAATIAGVSFFRSRAYDSRTGRWTQEDPIGLAGGVNLYQFNGNNPVSYSDPFGLCPDKMKQNHEECTKWNQGQTDKAKALIGAEAAAGNTDALPVTMGIIPVNGDEIEAGCKRAGSKNRTKYGCNDGTLMLINADAAVPMIAGTIVHEENHKWGASTFGPNSRQAGEPCAQKRQSRFIDQMHNPSDRAEAMASPDMQSMYNPNWPGCGF